MEDSFQFDSVLELSDNRLWGAHFAVPELVVKALTSNDKRVICRLNGTVEYQCAMVPKGEGIYVISVNKKLRDQLNLVAGSRVQVVLKKDESIYGLPMPEELAEVLSQDEEGNKFFHALTDGKIRTLLYIAGNVKSSEKRIERALIIVEHLKAQGGKLDYRKLNQALKSGQI